METRLHRINDEIRSREVRVVQHEEEEVNGVHPIEKAIQMAEERNQDLVEIVGNAQPPVCRIIEYSKLKYELKKKEKENKAKQQTVVLKEIRFGPNTDDHDFNFKLRHARNFLEEGNKIKAFVHFHGRSIVHKDRGADLLERFVEELDDIAKVEVPPKMEGKRMNLILAPKK